MVEVMIVAAIIVASTLAIMAVAQNTTVAARQAVHNLEATYLLEEGAEAVRLLRDNAWTNISTLSTGSDYYLLWSSGNWSFTATPQTTGIFTRKINVADVNRDAGTGDISSAGAADAGSKLFTISVSWSEGTRAITKTLPFYIMDIHS